MMNDETTLIPCPWCSEYPKIAEDGGSNGPWFCAWHDCPPVEGGKARYYGQSFGCISIQTAWFHTEAEAIAAWNTRMHGTLTAEQVREVLLHHMPHREYYSVEQTDAWQAIADELNAELGSGNCARCAEDMGRYADSLCDPLKERIAELLRCLENDWHIHASWDGLRKFWNVEWHANLDCPSDPGEAAMMCVNAFIAEHSDESCGQHADQGERDDEAECESCDSREKLEADVRGWMHEHIIQPHDSVSKVFDWLDRQAAITKRQCCDEQLDRERKDWKRWCEDAERKSAELQAKVDQLEREVQWWSDDKDIVIKQNVELQERIKQQSELIEKLAKERDKAICECEKYRDRLGKALDLAHEIGRLAD